MSQPVQVEIPPIEEINYLIPHSSFCTTTCGKEVTVFLAPFLRKHLETTVAESKLATENTSTHPPTQLDEFPVIHKCNVSIDAIATTIRSKCHIHHNCDPHRLPCLLFWVVEELCPLGMVCTERGICRACELN